MKHPVPSYSRRSLRTPGRRRLGRTIAGVLAVGSVALLASPSAEAHFILETPASWMSQDGLGMPQKGPPCGDEGGGTVTSTITALHPGETVTITVNEVIFHPGHYRIALATDRSLLPAEPTVTPGAQACGTVPIMNPPVFPVLADGVFVHTSAFNGPQTTQVTLPTNLTCTKCTLQVIQFMSDHPLNNPGGCFYHHCADISIQAGADPDGSAGEPPDAASTGGSSGSGSGGGSSGGSSSGSSSGGSGSGGSGSGGSGSGGIASGSGGALDGADASTNNIGPGPAAGGCVISGPASGAGAIGSLAGLFALASVLRRRRRG